MCIAAVGRLVIRVPGSLAVYRNNLGAISPNAARTQFIKQPDSSGRILANTRLKVSWEGIPEGSQETLLTILLCLPKEAI